MQRWNDDHPIWDLVMSIGGSVGTIISMLWATLLLNPYVPAPFNRRIASLVCVLIAVLMLLTATTYWHQWKQRR
jgi:uncharacterized protein YhhL (DUF1145 family)